MNTQVHGEACRWLVEFRTEDVDADARRRFAAWLRTSPEHVAAYLQVSAVWEDASLVDSERKVDIDALIADSAAQENVVELTAVAEPCRPSDSSCKSALPAANRRYWFRASAAAIAGLAVILTAWLMLNNDPHYRTALGEQRTLRLEDGSTVTLNALSEIRVRLSKRERSIKLLAGQALFRVAKDKHRPFIVASGGNFIRAVGTQFDVSRKSSATVVTVVEGRVAVLSHESIPHPALEALADSRSIELIAGEQVRLTADGGRPRPHTANVASATAWTQQLLIFESTPLPEVAEEFNRFNTRQLIVDGISLAGFNVSGMFPALDPASLPRLLAFLREQPGIEVVEQDNQIFVRQK